MPVTAIFVWACEKCHTVETVTEGIGPWSDPVAVPPDGWDYLSDKNTWACAACVAKEKPDANPPGK